MTDLFDFPTTHLRRLSPKERQLHKVASIFTSWVEKYPSTGLEEDEAVESLTDALAELSEVLSSARTRG